MTASEKKGIAQNLSERLFDGRYGELVNIKFCRGSDNIIDVDDMRAEVHSALVQKEQGRATISKEPVHSAAPTIDVGDYVGKL